MFNRIRRTNASVVGSGPGAGFRTNDAGRLITQDSSTDGDRYLNPEVGVFKTASWTLTPLDMGKTFYFNSATQIIAQLPTAASCPGGRVRFAVRILDGGATGHSISNDAANYFYGNGFTPTLDKNVVCPVASDRIGDFIEFESDGVLGWQISAINGTWTQP